MRILILGCDKLGAHVAASLAAQGHRIMVMDAMPACLDSLPDEPTMEAVLTSESLMEDLRRVGMNNVDAFLALTEDDNENAMAAQVASHIFHVNEVICRVGDPQREKFYRELGIKVVSPTMMLVDTIKSALKDGA